MGLRNGLLVGLFAFGLASTGLASTSAASSSPETPRKASSVSFTFEKSNVTSSEKPVVEYSTRGVPSGAEVKLQIKTGSSWTNVTSLSPSTRTRSTEIGKRSLGVYKFRVAIIKRGSVLAQQSSRLRVFGKVAFSKLIDENYSDVISHNSQYATDDGVVHKTNFNSLVPRHSYVILSISKTSCKSYRVGIVYDVYRDEDKWTLDHLIGGKVLKSWSIMEGKWVTKSRRVPLKKAWQLNSSQESNSGALYGMGTALCYTSDGKA